MGQGDTNGMRNGPHLEELDSGAHQLADGLHLHFHSHGRGGGGRMSGLSGEGRVAWFMWSTGLLESDENE